MHLDLPALAPVIMSMTSWTVVSAAMVPVSATSGVAGAASLHVTPAVTSNERLSVAAVVLQDKKIKQR